jgi:polyisoprenoid-binding protein YceI
MNTKTLSLIVLTALAPLAAEARDWQMDAAHSALRFSGIYQDAPFHGQFKQFTPVIRFDPATLVDARFDVNVSTRSADAGDADKNSTLATPDFFYPDKFPSARFVTKAFRKTGDGAYEADAELTIRDQTRALKFPFHWSEAGGKAHLTAKLALDRIDYGVGGGDWADDGLIARKIDVEVDLQLTPK